MVKKDKKWDWTEKQEKVFKELKERFTKELVLAALDLDVRRGSHQGGSPQNVLGDEQTCGTTLASAYVLRRLSAAWSQLQMKEGSPSGIEC